MPEISRGYPTVIEGQSRRVDAALAMTVAVAALVNKLLCVAAADNPHRLETYRDVPR
jgi:hypothetical protein